MRVLKDLIGGTRPATLEVPYNGSLDVDCVTKRYKGSTVKLLDYDNIDHGRFYTWGGLATAGENVCGILEEEIGITGSYLPDNATNGMVYRKMTPCFGSTIIQAEYAQKDAAGTDNYDTDMAGAAGSAALTGSTITGTGDMAGGWVYFLNGSCASYLHYIVIATTSTNVLTLGTALAAAVVSADDFLVILPPCVQKCLMDATYTGIKSELTFNSHTHPIMGISTWITAPGIPMQKLDRAKHDGLKIANARFYHQFALSGSDTVPNAWSQMYNT